MKHLIAAVSERVPISTLRVELQAAHDYLAEAAKSTAAKLPDLSVSSWGTAAKRTAVCLVGRRPARVADHVTEHSFAEIVNQCATLERLLDALRWAETDASGLREYEVLLCNPTTSSSAAVDDHDLVLRGPGGDRAKFEVSDVASAKDGNGKEVKDLTSLGCLDKDGGIRPHGPKGASFWSSRPSSRHVCGTPRDTDFGAARSTTSTSRCRTVTRGSSRSGQVEQCRSEEAARGSASVSRLYKWSLLAL